jgi:hypothetical protein
MSALKWNLGLPRIQPSEIQLLTQAVHREWSVYILVTHAARQKLEYLASLLCDSHPIIHVAGGGNVLKPVVSSCVAPHWETHGLRGLWICSCGHSGFWKSWKQMDKGPTF